VVGGRGKTSATRPGFVQQGSRGTPNSARAMLTPEARNARLRRAVMVVIGTALAAGIAFAPPFPTSSRLALAISPPDARVTVDGRPVTAETARIGVPIPLARTRHIVITRPGHAPVEVAARGGIADRSVAVTLAAVATLELDSTPTDAAVEVNGIAMGPTPLALTELSPGPRVSVTFDKPGPQRPKVRPQVPRAGRNVRATCEEGDPCDQGTHPRSKRIRIEQRRFPS